MTRLPSDATEPIRREMTHPVYVLRGGAYLLDEHAGVLIDSAGNFSAKTRGNPRALAVLLRAIAEDIEDDCDACICTPAIAGISDGPNIDCPWHGAAPRGES